MKEFMKNSITMKFLALALLALPLTVVAQPADDDGHGHIAAASRVYNRDYSKTDKIFAEIKTH